MNKWYVSYAEDNGIGFEYKSIKDAEMAGRPVISASVPGNFELDLMSAGILKKNPYTGDGCIELRKYEYYHVFYSCIFEWNNLISDNCDVQLLAEGIDTVADVYLNGEIIGSCDNMFIEHNLDLSGIKQGENEIFIHIKPTVLEARKYPSDIGTGMMSYSYESAYIRKAAHSFGWDIAPRALSCGIWKPIYIKIVKKPRIKEMYLIQGNIDSETGKGTAHLRYILDIGNDKCDRYKLVIDGVCGDSKFHVEHIPWFVSNRVGFEIENCKLWNIRGRGEQNLYDVTVTLMRDDEPQDSKSFGFGFRNVYLENSEIIDDRGNGEFRFYVNDEPIFVMGTNWVPADMFHSRDKERIPEILKLAADCGCNAIRCWGGNVYEDDLFYDLCDELGIMVWQDFAMACGTYPQDERMQKMIEEEATAVVRRLRQHPCICLWAGDNECDIMQMPTRDPKLNILTRQILPQVINRHDGTRPYLPSSPYVSDKAYKVDRSKLAEQHLWGPRDRFKGEYYSKAEVCFASEIGYHGCPSPDSVVKFIDKEYLWPPQNNKQWILHCTSPEYPNGEFAYRVELMLTQIRNLFGANADNLESFAAMSQISQAEADKYFIERFRINKNRCGGILWWNIMDCWPQFSDAVVDYYFVKKLAYHYIKVSQQQFCIAMDDGDGNLKGYAVNDCPYDVKVRYCVTDTESGEVASKGECSVSADKTESIFTVKKPENNTFYKIEWTVELVGEGALPEKNGINHYLSFDDTIDFKWYIERMKSISKYKFEGFGNCLDTV